MDETKEDRRNNKPDRMLRIDRILKLLKVANQSISLVFMLALPAGVVIGALLAYRHLQVEGHEWAFAGLVGDWMALLTIAVLGTATMVVFALALLMPILADMGVNLPDSEGWKLGIHGTEKEKRADSILRAIVVLPLALIFGFYVLIESAAVVWILCSVTLIFAVLDMWRLLATRRIVHVKVKKGFGQDEDDEGIDQSKPIESLSSKTQFVMVYLLRLFFLTFPLLILVIVYNTVFGSLPIVLQWVAVFLVPIVIVIPYATADIRGYALASLVVLGLATGMLVLAPPGVATEQIFSKWNNAGRQVEIECISQRCSSFLSTADKGVEVVLEIGNRTIIGVRDEVPSRGIWLHNDEYFEKPVTEMETE